MRRFFILPGLMVVLSAAHAQEKADWKKNYAGLDGISAQCELTTSRTNASTMCKRIMAEAKLAASSKGINFFFAEKVADKNQGKDPQSVKTTRPLQLHILIKGTSDRTPGASVSMRLYLDYTHAVQQGDTQSQPRSGKLVFWRKDLIGTGPAERLTSAMVSVMSKALREVIGDIAASVQKGQNGKL